MPEIANPLENAGYLIAAGLITLVTLAGYVTAVIRRLAETRARNDELRRQAQAIGIKERR